MRKLSMDPRDSFPQDARLRHRCGGLMGVGVGDGERCTPCCEPPYTEVFLSAELVSGSTSVAAQPNCTTSDTKASVFRRPFAKVGALPTAELPANSARELGTMTSDVPLQIPDHAPRTSVHAAERSIGGGWRCSDHRVGQSSGVAQWPVTESGERGPFTCRGPPDAR
jgi:hypothetical protein